MVGISKNKIFITLDLDWASDEIIDYCANILLKNSVKATWFITHESPVVKRLLGYPDLFEVGLHPNFLAHSTQGKSIREVMDYLIGIHPDARLMRTHSLYQSTPMFCSIMENYPQLKLDVSLYVPYARDAQLHYFFHMDKQIARIPYIWEDDFELICAAGHGKRKGSVESLLNGIVGLKVFDFHPIHIALNSCSLDSYNKLKSKKDITKATLKDVLRFRNGTKDGIEDFLMKLIRSGRKTCLFRELRLY